MNCDPTRELLPWLLNGTLDEIERRAVREHLTGCEACRRELAATRLAGRIFAAHLPAAELVAYAFDLPTALDRGRIAAHLARCPSCAGELALVAESRRLSDAEGEAPVADAGGGAEVVPFRRPAAPAPAPPRERLWRPAALAAGLTALVAAGGWMWSWTETRSLAGRVAAERSATATAAERLAGLERQTARLSAAAAEARDQVARLEAELASGAAGGAAARPGLHLNTPVVDLFSGDVVVRGAGSGAPGRTALPGGAGLLTLILNVDPGPSYPDYELRVIDARGGAVRRERGLRRDPDAGNFTVSLPAALLGSGEATLEVYGIAADGAATRIARYPVTVGG
jgi:anti-sigma factor RsiW